MIEKCRFKKAGVILNEVPLRLWRRGVTLNVPLTFRFNPGLEVSGTFRPCSP